MRHERQMSISESIPFLCGCSTITTHSFYRLWTYFSITAILLAVAVHFTHLDAPRWLPVAFVSPRIQTISFQCQTAFEQNESQFEQCEPNTGGHAWSFNASRDSRNYGLTREQCHTAFPGLFSEIESSVTKRKDNHITKDELLANGSPDGAVKATIFNGKLYVLETTHHWIGSVYHTRAMATLHAINRALGSAPDAQDLPDIEFMIHVRDIAFPALTVWSYSRKANYNKTWVIPDFGFWSWPDSSIGTYAEALQKIHDVEVDSPDFLQKIPKIFWRGAARPDRQLRETLLRATEDKPWANVKEVNWQDPLSVEQNYVPIEDQCRYMFIVYTEGFSFSGRLKYHQNCRSVIISHRMQWVIPHSYLLTSSGPKQNYIEVERDWSDLEEKVQYYTKNPEEAERIVNNSVEMFRDRYLTPAAESCYWRELIRGYGSVSFTPDEFTTDDEGKRIRRGEAFESFVLNQALKAVE